MKNKQQAWALVTGGSRGIGRAICIQLARQGYPVVINYKGNVAAAEETAALVAAEGQAAALLPFDVTDRNKTREALQQWQDGYPDQKIEVLVNNAGIRQDALLAFMEDEQWDAVLNTSLQGVYHVTRSLIKSMVLQRYGRIINIVSLSGLKGMAGQTNYAAAKAGIIGVTKALALEVAKRGVTVNAIAPGFIQSDMTASLDEKELSSMIPMNRFGRPEEVAALCGFLASENAGYITGQVVSINGGLYT